jgi:hypothetical protein
MHTPTLFALPHKWLFSLLALLLLSAVTAPRLSAQEFAEPDYKEIRQATTNTKSPNYYPRLMRRYLKCDSTLSLQQYRYLYYGFTLQEDFVPYQLASQPLLACRKQILAQQNDAQVYERAIKLSEAALENNPFDLLAISTLAVSYLQRGDTTNFQLWNAKQNSLLDVILSSGDGDAPESAFHVINVEHEYEIINRLGLVIEADSLCNSSIEYLRVRENAEGERGFYFNFGACNKIYKKRYE